MTPPSIAAFALLAVADQLGMVGSERPMTRSRCPGSTAEAVALDVVGCGNDIHRNSGGTDMNANLLSLAQEAMGGDFSKLAGQFLGESPGATQSALSFADAGRARQRRAEGCDDARRVRPDVAYQRRQS